MEFYNKIHKRILSGKISQQVFSYLLIFIMFFCGSGGLLNFFGGLLKDRDSEGYEQFAVAPWVQLGDWHPPGVSFLLYLGAKVGLNHFTTYQLISALICFFLFCLFEQKLNRKWAIFLSILVFLDPALILIRISLWSETPFVLCITLLGFLLSLKRFQGPAKIFWVVILSLFATQVRLSGIFLFPAIAVALGYVWKDQKWKFQLRTFGFGAGTLLLTWMSMNFLITGKPLQTSRLLGAAASCRSIVLSMNQFPYCTWDPTIAVCALDPERKVIGNISLTQYDEGLLELHYYPHLSPVTKYSISDPDKICKVQTQVLKQVLIHAPFDVVKLLSSRVWNQFGPWHWDQRDPPMPGFAHMDHLYWLDDYLKYVNHPQHFFKIILVLVSIAILVSASFRAEMIYFWLGSLGHAVGISIGNPFRALRYMAISKYCLFICFAYLLFQWSPSIMKFFQTKNRTD